MSVLAAQDPVNACVVLVPSPQAIWSLPGPCQLCVTDMRRPTPLEPAGRLRSTSMDRQFCSSSAPRS